MVIQGRLVMALSSMLTQQGWCQSTSDCNVKYFLSFVAVEFDKCGECDNRQQSHHEIPLPNEKSHRKGGCFHLAVERQPAPTALETPEIVLNGWSRVLCAAIGLYSSYCPPQGLA